MSSSNIIISGVSGSGSSTALKAVADLGFYAIDNLPVALLKEFIELTSSDPKRYSKTVILPELKSPTSVGQFLSLREQIGVKRFQFIFLDASTECLIKRYSESRRPHPIFNSSKDRSLTDAIQRERNFLIACKEIADFCLDTTTMTVHDLRRKITDFVGQSHDNDCQMRVNLVSFGFKYGIPLDCDLIVDVRFLPNPHFIPELRNKTGKDVEVSKFVLDNQVTNQFLDRYTDLLLFLLPKYLFEGKAYLNIGIGCTGGRHRSVTLAEELANRVLSQKDSSLRAVISVDHRDITK